MKNAGSIYGPQGEPSILLRSAGGEAVTVDDPSLLFSAEFHRQGPDLVLENAGAPDIRIVDYFAHAIAPDLATPDGATLRGQVVERLAGPEAPGQYAQAGASSLGDPIGQVETLEGIARAQRVDGTVVELEVGTKVYRNDVLMTESGGTVSVTFVDGTIFTLASGSRMVLDDLVYAEGSGQNSAAFSLVEGSFVFIAGQVAKTGGMDVTTPSATMGIRGTTGLVDIRTVQGVTTVSVSLNTDPDGGLGEIVISDLDGNAISTITATDTKWVVPVGGEAYEVERTADELATDSEILDEAAAAYASALGRVRPGRPSSSSTAEGHGRARGATISKPEPRPNPAMTGTVLAMTPMARGRRVLRPFRIPAPTRQSVTTTRHRRTRRRQPLSPRTFWSLGNTDGAITGTVVATDPDSDESPEFSLAQGPTDGEVTVNPDGSFSYTANDGFSGFDRFEVTASDGSLSDTATVTVAVNDPGSQEALDLGLGITIDDESVDGRPAGSVNVTRATVEATPINLVFAMDGSGSFSDNFAAQITAVEEAITRLAEDFDGQGAPQVDVQLIVFSNDATSYGKNGVDDPSDGFVPFDLVQDKDALLDQLGAITSPDGTTNWAAAINDAKAFFDQENAGGADEVDILYFITDGQPTENNPWQAAVKDIRDAHDPQIFTFGLGEGFDPENLEQTFTLDGTEYRFDSDGAAKTIGTASDLTAEIQKTGLFAPELTSFSLTLASDGTDHGEIATEIDTDGAGFTLPLAGIDGIEDKLGDTNDFVVEAVFDLDGDPDTTGDQITIVKTGRLSAPDGPVSLVGSDGPDLLLGGKAADTLDGGDGNDLLIGGGGADTLLGGAGDDLIVPGAPGDTLTPPDTALVDGGPGRDTLKFDMGGDLTSDVLPTLSITDIEALDMTNGEANALSLTLADIEGLSSDPDTALEALLGEALPDSATVYGDDGDTLTLSNPDGRIDQNPTGTGPVTDGDGTESRTSTSSSMAPARWSRRSPWTMTWPWWSPDYP